LGFADIITNRHIPIFIPPFDAAGLKGVIPLTQGFTITDSPKLNAFKEKLEKTFSLTPIENANWENKRTRILKRINDKIKNL